MRKNPLGLKREKEMELDNEEEKAEVVVDDELKA